jgi:homoserine dehydrogenase
MLMRRNEAKRAQVEFRFESTVMDGTPVFNLLRNSLPGLRVKGFTGVLSMQPLGYLPQE